MSLTMNLYDPDICDGHFCPKDCDVCSPWAELAMEKLQVEALEWRTAKQKAAEIIKAVTTPNIQVKIPAETVESNLYDQEEIYTNCTVQIWRNSVTGEESIGWWQNEEGSG